jgi:hypothetical protein
MMKVSRSIRKKCNGAILIAFAATMLAVCISPVLASATYIPPDPTNLTNTTGRYWVNYTWQAGSGGEVDLPDFGDKSASAVFDMGNVTDSYNVSVNGGWYNGTTNTSINETVGSGEWVNITVWAWNASGTGMLSAVCVRDDAQAQAQEGLGGTFGLVGSIPTGGGGGTYPPGWFETPTPAVTATKTPAASATATATATSAPPSEHVTPTPAPTKTKPAAAETTAPAAEGTTAETAKKSASGFTAVFVIAGMLAAAYAVMRRRE